MRRLRFAGDEICPSGKTGTALVASVGKAPPTGSASWRPLSSAANDGAQRREDSTAHRPPRGAVSCLSAPGRRVWASEITVTVQNTQQPHGSKSRAVDSD